MKKNGNQICLRYHCSGFCFKDCKFASGHGTLEGEEKADLIAFMAKARDARKNFATKNRPRQGNDQTTTSTPATSARAAGDAPVVEGEG